LGMGGVRADGELALDRSGEGTKNVSKGWVGFTLSYGERKELP